MTLLFVDGFDHYATADMTKKWNFVGGTGGATIAGSGGRRGGGALTIATNLFAYHHVWKSFPAAASLVIGFAYKVTALNSQIFVRLYDESSVQVQLELRSDGALRVTRAGTTLTDGLSVSTLSADTWYYIELKVTIADSISAGSCKVRVNGADWITVATGQDTKVTANASVNKILLGCIEDFPGSATILFDDLYVCNQSGATNNDFLGDCRVDTLFPTAEGNYSDFTPSAGTDNALNVDETAPNTTDYNSSTTLNHRDSFAMQDLAPLVSQAVYGVQVSAAVYKDDSGTRGMAPFVRSGATDSADGATLGLGTSMVYASHIFEQNPAGAIPWTEAAVNAAEAGVKVTL